MKLRGFARVAFSLVEIALALGVVAFSLLALLGLLATGAQVNHVATEQTASTDILTAVAADLRATPSGTGTSTQYGVSIPANPANTTTPTTFYFDATGQLLSLDEGPRYRLVITFFPNAGGKSATIVNLRATWPATADPAVAATGSSEIFVALDRN